MQTKNNEIKTKKQRKKLSPPVKITLGFLVTILTGSLLLLLPFARTKYIPYLDLLFTSTSAVCVVGLTVLDIAESFTLFGQLVILLLIQIGGLGFMAVATLVFIFIGKKITLKERLALSEAYNQDDLQGLVRMTKYIILFTVITELGGAALLSISFVGRFGFLKGVYYSVFHAVSAFCNAGISLVDLTDPVYGNSVIVTLSLASLIFIGGLGFAVIRDIISNKRAGKFAFNTKVVLFTSLTLIGVSTLLLAVSEWTNPATIGNETFFGKLLRCLFQAVTPRTAGFNMIVQSDMTGAGRLITLVNMFIGASPASTGGGLKTTTAFLLLVTFIAGLKGEEKEITVFGKSISYKAVNRAVLLLIFSLLTLFVSSVLIVLFESGSAVSPEEAVFEAVSAFATVGLSLGITAQLCEASKIVIIILMFIGRLGSLVLGLFFIQRKHNEGITIKHPEGKIVIG